MSQNLDDKLLNVLKVCGTSIFAAFTLLLVVGIFSLIAKLFGV